MAKIIFEGWEAGMRKIPFIKLLHEKANLTLREAKNLKSRLVDNNEVIEIEISEEVMSEVIQQATEMKVKVRIG